MFFKESQVSDGIEVGGAPAPRPTGLAIFPHEPLPPQILTRVDQDLSGGLFGPFDADLLARQAAAFISSNSDGVEERLTPVMRKFLVLAEEDCSAGHSSAEETLGDRGTHSCWLCIRMSVPTDYWVVPRWHTDGRMFDCTCPEPRMPHSKYAFTILGPSTRVMVPNPAVRAVMEMGMPSEKGRRWDTNAPNPELAKILSEYPEARIEQGQVIRFSWNEPDSPVHSEPDSSGLHRVFVSILFGSEEEIHDMCGIRSAEYGFWYSR